MFKFCIGNPEGLRSTIWKVWTHNRNVYLQSRMMGYEAKLSFHDSGQAQWSLTDEWVRRTGAKNIERHFCRWQIQQLADIEEILVFRLFFPESKLQQVGKPRKYSQIQWITPPPFDNVKVVECYISKLHGDKLKASVPWKHLESFQIDQDRSFVLRIYEEPVKDEFRNILLKNKERYISYVGSTAIDLPYKTRSVIFIKKPVPEMIEVNAKS